MKLLFQPLGLCLVLSLACMLACENKPASTTNEAVSNSAELGRIPFQTAAKRVKQYLQIYGEGVQSFDIPDSCRQNYKELYERAKYDQKLLLPKYFVVNSQEFAFFMERTKDKERIFASFGLKHSFDSVAVNLLFHDVRPDPNGRFITKKHPIQIIDYNNTCPSFCNQDAPHGGFNGGCVGVTRAVKRINCYNCIFGKNDPGEFETRLFQNKDGSASVLIPRYFSFNRSDIQELLETIKDKHQFFYVSMGAELVDGSESVYQSDLIFHVVHPEISGELKGSSGGNTQSGGDPTWDITKPCPDAC